MPEGRAAWLDAGGPVGQILVPQFDEAEEALTAEMLQERVQELSSQTYRGAVVSVRPPFHKTTLIHSSRADSMSPGRHVSTRGAENVKQVVLNQNPILAAQLQAL